VRLCVQTNHDNNVELPRRQEEEIATAAHGISEATHANKIIAKAHVPLRSGDAERLLSGHAFAVRAALTTSTHRVVVRFAGLLVTNAGLWFLCHRL
jgi:hypothetical protein